MATETKGNKVSVDKVRNAVKAYGLQKQIAAELGTSDANLSKFLDGQLPLFGRLLEVLGLEVVERGEVDELKSVLKRYL